MTSRGHESRTLLTFTCSVSSEAENFQRQCAIAVIQSLFHKSMACASTAMGGGSSAGGAISGGGASHGASSAGSARATAAA
eukprot:CAMPEP_0195636990 /NCGR_PEP_ID=MMETSP0815-20121206/24174_2 /TAXON_ID=97485 /ORGANISM="Prymnesium parvum, Strain Texoma1" /LENGTH=80 /DNA_ID=CAMNT_0040779157 /DNA_START=499 /DNA_END=739 /DNA_ORIENTATION=-